MTKIFIKLGTEGYFLNLVKNIYNKLIVNIILIGEKLNTFLLRSGTRRRYPFTAPSQHHTGSPGLRKNNKRI